MFKKIIIKFIDIWTLNYLIFYFLATTLLMKIQNPLKCSSINSITDFDISDDSDYTTGIEEKTKLILNSNFNFY